MGESAKLYGKHGCPHCFNARRDFDTRGIEYEDIDVQTDGAALKEMLKLNGGLRRVPTIVEGDQVTVGYKGGY